MDLKKSILFILIILLFSLSPTMASVEITDARMVSEVSVQITESGTISITSGSLDWLKINQTIPQNHPPLQQVSTDTEIVTDSLGNELSHIYLDKPNLLSNYNIKTDVISKSIHTGSISNQYIIPDSIKIYLESSENIQSNNPNIIAIAKEITKDSIDDFEKVVKLALWVNNNLEYDMKYGDVTKDALWVLNNKVGVCAEYTTLFTAFARASGIPARYVSAQAYGEHGWEPHAYSEVYLGKWIPVDPLWLEVGYLDATHIKYTIQQDNIVMNDVKAYGSDIGKILWTDLSTVIDVKSVKTADRFVYDSLYYSETLESGDDVFVIAGVTGPDYRLEQFNLEPCKGTTINPIIIENKKTDIIFKANQKKYVIWTGKVSDALNSRMIYTCPLVIYSAFFKLENMPITISSQQKNSVELEVTLSNINMNLGGTQTVYATIRRVSGTGPLDVIVVTDDLLSKQVININPGESFNLEESFPILKKGNQDVYVFVSSGDLLKLSYYSGDSGLLLFDDFTLPSAIKINTPLSAEIKVINDKTVPQSIKLHMDDDIESVVVDKSIERSFDIDTTVLGLKKVNVKIVDGTNVLDEINKQVIVYDIPIVEVSDVAVNIDGLTTVSIENSVDAAKNIELTIGDSFKKLDSLLGKKSLLFDGLSPGEYSAKLIYEDASGESYSKNITVTVRNENILEKIIRFLSTLIKSFYLG
ncbi:MAG: transglutaminase-like domain-containing protein [DPANN group archaeon]|nr:transglutaminase-like domain-containing protein [DPANN group archaeon]